MRACHSEPIRGKSGQTIASLMLCFAEARLINSWERDVAKFACAAASVAIEHERRDRALREGEARFHRLADVMSVRLDEQRAIISDYQRADQASKSASERKDEFLAILVHELRNPLAALESATHTLEKTEHRGEAASLAVAMVRRQVDHMSRLLDDLTNAARVTHGLVQLRLEPVSMQDAIREAVEATRHQIESRQHRLSLHLADEAIYVHGDAVRLNQIIVNLLTNAVKYTPMGGTIDVRLTRSRGAAVLVVRDDGMGISAEMLPKIFDMYSRANPRDTGRATAWASGSRSSRVWSNCIAAPSKPEVPAKGAAASSSSPCRSVAATTEPQRPRRHKSVHKTVTAAPSNRRPSPDAPTLEGS